MSAVVHPKKIDLGTNVNWSIDWYRLCKLIVVGEKNYLILLVARMVIDARGWESEWKFKIILNGIDKVKCHGLPCIVLIPNGDMPLSGEHAMFGLAHTSWWVNQFICQWIRSSLTFYMF